MLMGGADLATPGGPKPRPAEFGEPGDEGHAAIPPTPRLHRAAVPHHRARSDEGSPDE